METKDKNQILKDIDRNELADVLTTISVIAKQLAMNLRTAEAAAVSDLAEEETQPSDTSAKPEPPAKAAPAKKSPAKTPEPPAPVPTYTKEQVRAVLAAKSSAGFTDDVKALLEKFGAKQLKQVRESDYSALIKEAEVIGNA